MAHPCADHLAICDHCYLCDGLGICCCSSAAHSAASVDAALDNQLAEKLLGAAAHDRVLGLDLVRAFAIDSVNHALDDASDFESLELAAAMAADVALFTSTAPPRALPAPSPDLTLDKPMEVVRAYP